MFLRRFFFSINYLFLMTLIELMVVIVIISILNAVAVPKLFGMMTKSKASELSPAAKPMLSCKQYTATVPADGEVLTPTFTRLGH